MVGSKERQLIPGFFTPSPAVSTWLKKITDIVLKKFWHLVAKIEKSLPTWYSLTGLLNILMSHHLTNPSAAPVKNSVPVFPIQRAK